jgi:MscS family membrane protein
MHRLSRSLPGALLLLAGTLLAQTPPAAEIKDPLGRTSPQSSILQFLEACHARDYAKATYYLDLRKMSPAERAKDGPQLAMQLEDLLDDTPFDIATLSRDPLGDQSDSLSPQLEHLYTFHVDGKTLDLQLERVELKPGLRVWLVSAQSVALISEAHTVVVENPFEKHLPQTLVTFEILDTPVWRWFALVVIGLVLWLAAGLVARVSIAVLRPVFNAPDMTGPLRLCLAIAGFRAAMELAPPSSLPRLFIERALGIGFSLVLAWLGAVLVDYAAERWRAKLDPRIQAVSYSVLPLGRQILKLTLYLIAVLTVISAWGYNTSTIVAGLGVGGLAVALAAQKTIENLFGGVSVIGDRPVLVGDFCKFGDKMGTVMHIGLRSTRIRTPDRTIISVPNGQFSSMPLENCSVRDKFLFHPTFNLRFDTTHEQLSKVVASLRAILSANDKLEKDGIPVRLVAVDSSSFRIEVEAYVKTSTNSEFLALQQELLLVMLKAIEDAGTSLAVPLTESYRPPRQA